MVQGRILGLIMEDSELRSFMRNEVTFITLTATATKATCMSLYHLSQNMLIARRKSECLGWGVRITDDDLIKKKDKKIKEEIVSIPFYNC